MNGNDKSMEYFQSATTPTSITSIEMTTPANGMLPTYGKQVRRHFTLISYRTRLPDYPLIILRWNVELMFVNDAEGLE